MGYFDSVDLPYYYFMATQFATSDRPAHATHKRRLLLRPSAIISATRLTLWWDRKHKPQPSPTPPSEDRSQAGAYNPWPAN